MGAKARTDKRAKAPFTTMTAARVDDRPILANWVPNELNVDGSGLAAATVGPEILPVMGPVVLWFAPDDLTG